MIEIGANGGSVASGGRYPQPIDCAPKKVFNVHTSPEAKYLNVCQGRTDEHICATGNGTEMKQRDETIRSTLLLLKDR